jgi:hypothetical protein
MNNKYTYKCTECNKQGTTNKPNKKTCSSQCLKDKYKTSNCIEGVSRGSAGAMAEMMVCADLLKNDYAVFRAISPSCFCDVIAIKNNEMKQFEVRTAYERPSGKLSYVKNLSHKNGTPTHFALYIASKNRVDYVKI